MKPRPKADDELRQMARKFRQKAVETLGAALDSEHENVRVMAAKELLDRDAGRPQQSIAISDSRDVTELSEQELIEIARGGSSTRTAATPSGEKKLSDLH